MANREALEALAQPRRNYDEQQMVSQHSNNLLDQCKLLRAHIRDVINKCLSETQKMQLGMQSTAVFAKLRTCRCDAQSPSCGAIACLGDGDYTQPKQD